MSPRLVRALAAFGVTFALASPLTAQEGDATLATLRLELRGVRAERSGPVSCALFRSAEEFPMESQRRGVTRASAQQEGGRWICVFDGLAPGTYAVAVLHDFDADERVDTNLFGAPTEGWGSTNNVTHDFSAPSFDESSVRLDAGQTRALVVQMHY